MSSSDLLVSQTFSVASTTSEPHPQDPLLTQTHSPNHHAAHVFHHPPPHVHRPRLQRIRCDGVLRPDLRQRGRRPAHGRVLGRAQRDALEGLLHVRFAPALPQHRRRGSDPGVELGAVRLLLEAHVPGPEHQRARDRPHRRGLQHRARGDEHAHEQPGRVLGQNRRTGDSGPRVAVRAVNLMRTSTWLACDGLYLGNGLFV